MVATLADTPVTIPVEPTVATAVLPLVQVPPPPSVRVVVAPMQACRTPVIGDGEETTDTVVVAAHPPGRV